jgi:hypothetical protein
MAFKTISKQDQTLIIILFLDYGKMCWDSLLWLNSGLELSRLRTANWRLATALTRFILVMEMGRPNAHTGVIPPPTVQGATGRHRAGNTEHWDTSLDNAGYRITQAKDRVPDATGSPSTAVTLSSLATDAIHSVVQ